MSTLELARSAAIADAGNADLVGADVSVEIDDDGRVETYLFEAHLAGYKGWRWCVTIAVVD